MKLTNFVLAALIAGAVPSYAQYAACVSPLTLNCTVGNTCSQNVSAYRSNIDGVDVPNQIPVVCCGQVMQNYYHSNGCCCDIIKNLAAPATSKALARLSKQGPVFLVACNGDLLPYSTPSAQARPWSADRLSRSFASGHRIKGASNAPGPGSAK